MRVVVVTVKAHLVALTVTSTRVGSVVWFYLENPVTQGAQGTAWTLELVTFVCSYHDASWLLVDRVDRDMCPLLLRCNLSSANGLQGT